MRGPYRFTVKDGAVELAAAANIGLLKDAERQGHFAAGEWVAADIVSGPRLEIFDANETLVRVFVVYDRDGTRLANSIVRERLS